MGDTHELKPCPFCDGAPRIVEPHQSDRSIEGETDDEEWLSFIECDCVDMFFVKGSATSQDEARQSVVTAWNRRPALSAGQAQPVAHLVWLQGRRAIDDVEDYYEVARPGDKSVDGSDPFPVYAALVPPAVPGEDDTRDLLMAIENAARMAEQGILSVDGGQAAVDIRSLIPARFRTATTEGLGDV